MLLTSISQEWQFHIDTDIANLACSSGIYMAIS